MNTLVSRVIARFAAESDNSSLSKGDILEVWIKRGDWWSEMRRGVKLEVKDANGNEVKVNHRGFSTPGWTMTLPSGQDLSGKFNLIGDQRFRRSLVVRKV